MLRVVRVVSSSATAARAIDTLILNAEQRRLQTGHLTGVNGTAIGVMLPEPILLRNGDALELDDGSIVDVVIAPEPLIEIRANDLTHLARLAWHLGDRHVPVQIFPNRLRMRPDGVLEAMLKGLGARKRRSTRKAALTRTMRMVTTMRAVTTIIILAMTMIMTIIIMTEGT